jgi:hypothetical protein
MSFAHFASRLFLHSGPMHRKVGLALGIMAVLVIASSNASAETFSAGGDLVTDMLSANPSNTYGPWRYGNASTATGGSFALSTIEVTGAFEGWWGTNLGPFTMANVTNTVQSGPGPIAPHDAFTHPGPNPTQGYTDFLFTAPATGPYLINTTFYPANTGTDDVHVVVNGVSVFDDFFANNSPASVNYTHLFNLTAGSTIAFTEGAFDSTMTTWSYNSNALGMDATITLLPEPSSLVALCGLGAVGLFFVARRRQGN